MLLLEVVEESGGVVAAERVAVRHLFGGAAPRVLQFVFVTHWVDVELDKFQDHDLHQCIDEPVG